MVQEILGNMRVCLGLSPPEPVAGLRLDLVGVVEWQYLAINTYASRSSGASRMDMQVV